MNGTQIVSRKISFSLILAYNFLLVCFSTVEDLKCQVGNNGTELDKIYFGGGCSTIQNICESNGLTGVNVNFCFNQTSNLQIPVNEVITRILSAEEFF